MAWRSVFALFFLFAGPAAAQSGRWELSVTASRVSTGTEGEVAYSPDVMLTRSVLVLDDQLRVFSGAHISAWDDGVSELRTCADCMTFSHRALTVGIRAGAQLSRFPIPIELGIGVGRQFLESEYLGGGAYGGEDWSEGVTILEFGAQMVFPVSAWVQVGASVRGTSRLGNESGLPYDLLGSYGLTTRVILH